MHNALPTEQVTTELPNDKFDYIFLGIDNLLIHKNKLSVLIDNPIPTLKEVVVFALDLVQPSLVFPDINRVSIFQVVRKVLLAVDNEV